MAALTEKLNDLLPKFRESLKQTFETMVFLPASCEAPVPIVNGGPMSDLSATIGITSTQFSGLLALAFPVSVAESVFRSMMMMGDGDAVAETELKDAVGELANMVAGGAKAVLQNEGMDCALGLPTVIVGARHQLQSPADAAVLLVPVSTAKGQFFMRIAIA
jgi:chemotaxis protein CheX